MGPRKSQARSSRRLDVRGDRGRALAGNGNHRRPSPRDGRGRAQRDAPWPGHRDEGGDRAPRPARDGGVRIHSRCQAGGYVVGTDTPFGISAGGMREVAVEISPGTPRCSRDAPGNFDHRRTRAPPPRAPRSSDRPRHPGAPPAFGGSSRGSPHRARDRGVRVRVGRRATAAEKALRAARLTVTPGLLTASRQRRLRLLPWSCRAPRRGCVPLGAPAAADIRPRESSGPTATRIVRRAADRSHANR